MKIEFRFSVAEPEAPRLHTWATESAADWPELRI